MQAMAWGSHRIVLSSEAILRPVISSGTKCATSIRPRFSKRSVPAALDTVKRTENIPGSL